MSIRPAILALAVLSVPALAEPTGTPAESAHCVFRTVHALPGGAGSSASMDPQITALREDLARPPFTAWKTFKLLDSQEANLAEGASTNFSTADGRTAVVTYTGHGHRHGQHFIKGALEFLGGKSTVKTAFTLDEGGHFVVAGHKYQGGILIHSLSCQTPHEAR
jgi:hypothetical protein